LEKYTKPLEEDLKFLKELTKPRPHHKAVTRTIASFALGKLAWDEGDRNKAAEHYREGIEYARSATTAEMTSLQMSSTGAKQPISTFLDDYLDKLRTNLSVLETGGTKGDYQKLFSSSGGVSMRVLGSCSEAELSMMRVGGSKCDHCGAVRISQVPDSSAGAAAPSSPPRVCETLTPCDTCLLAWYCGADCQRADGDKHSSWCRPVHALQGGDRVVLHSLKSRSDRNGQLAEVVRKAPAKVSQAPAPNAVVGESAVAADQRWVVLIESPSTAGKLEEISVAAKNIQRMPPPSTLQPREEKSGEIAYMSL